MQGSITWHDQSHRKFLHLQLSGMTTFVNLTIANIIKEAVTYKLSANDLPPSYESYDTHLQMRRRKPGDGGIGIMPQHTKLHSCFAGATGRSMSALAKANPKWLRHNWVDTSRFAAAESSFVKPRESLQQLDLSSPPEKVAQPMRARQNGLRGNFYPEKDDEAENVNEEAVEQDDDTDEDQGVDQEAEVENPNTCCDCWQQYQNSKPAHNCGEVSNQC